MNKGYQDDGKSRTLFVAKIADRISEDDLRRYFRKYGPLLRCEIKKGKGFGFVEYETRLYVFIYLFISLFLLALVLVFHFMHLINQISRGLLHFR